MPLTLPFCPWPSQAHRVSGALMHSFQDSQAAQGLYQSACWFSSYFRKQAYGLAGSACYILALGNIIFVRAAALTGSCSEDKKHLGGILQLRAHTLSYCLADWWQGCHSFGQQQDFVECSRVSLTLPALATWCTQCRRGQRYMLLLLHPWERTLCLEGNSQTLLSWGGGG